VRLLLGHARLEHGELELLLLVEAHLVRVRVRVRVDSRGSASTLLRLP